MDGRAASKRCSIQDADQVGDYRTAYGETTAKAAKRT